MGNQKWRDRITRRERVDACTITPNPMNWRTHPQAQRDALTGALASVGWVADVIVNERTNNLVDGHARVEEAIKRGEQVPVSYVDLSEEEEKIVLATLDPIGAMAGTDAAMLADLVESLPDVQELINELCAVDLDISTEHAAKIPAYLSDMFCEWAYRGHRNA